MLDMASNKQNAIFKVKRILSLTLSLAFFLSYKLIIISLSCGGARGVMDIVVGNGHGDTSSNPA